MADYVTKDEIDILFCFDLRTIGKRFHLIEKGEGNNEALKSKEEKQ